MKTVATFKAAGLAALAAAPFFALGVQPAPAQTVVAATCPGGYVLDGNSCVKTGPTPSCPSGYTFLAGKCITTTRVSAKTPVKTARFADSGKLAFITREAFGVKSATELDGANFCAVKGSEANDAQTFFKDNGLEATHVKVDNNRAGIMEYQKFGCDVLVVADRVARSTADGLEPKGGHMVLPEKFGTAPAAPVVKPAPAAAAVPAPVPTQQPVTVETQPAPPPAVKKTTPPPAKAKKKPVKKKPTKTARRKRCSAVRYGYTSGNTCKCAGGRVFTGSKCVRPRWF